MHWNYRIIKEYNLYYLGEVYYEDDKPVGWSEAETGYYTNRKELIDDLKLMLKDASYPTLEIGKDLEER